MPPGELRGEKAACAATLARRDSHTTRSVAVSSAKRTAVVPNIAERYRRTRIARPGSMHGVGPAVGSVRHRRRSARGITEAGEIEYDEGTLVLTLLEISIPFFDVVLFPGRDRRSLLPAFFGGLPMRLLPFPGRLLPEDDWRGSKRRFLATLLSTMPARIRGCRETVARGVLPLFFVTRT